MHFNQNKVMKKKTFKQIYQLEGVTNPPEWPFVLGAFFLL